MPLYSYPFSSFIHQKWREEKEAPFELLMWSSTLWGVGTGLYYGLPLEPGLLSLLCFAVAAFIGWKKMPWLSFLCGGFIFAALGSSFYGTPLIDDPLGPVTIQAKIARLEHKENGGVRLQLIDVHLPGRDQLEIPAYVYLTIPLRLLPAAGSFGVDSQLVAAARLMPLSPPLFPGGFDFRRSAYFKGEGASGYVMGRLEITPSAGPTSFSAETYFAHLRSLIRDRILAVLSGDQAGLAIILMTGDKSFLSASSAEAMRAVGLAHLLAIAGLHIGVVGGIVFFVFRFLMALWPALALRWPIKKIAALISLLAIAFYTMLVGAPIPTRRAFIMAGLFLLGVILDRLSLSMRSLALAAFLLLLLWPFMLLSPGFQLSFAAVAALIAVGKMRAHLPVQQGGCRRIFGHVVSIALMSIVATLGTLPFSLYHFQELGLYSALANGLAIPLTSFLLMPLCLLALFLMPMGMASPVLALLGRGIEELLRLSQFIAQLPGAHYLPPMMPLPLLLLATLGGLWFCLRRAPSRWLGLGLLFLSLGICLGGARPDVLISPDGGSIMWRRPQGVVMTGVADRPDKFLMNIWARALGQMPDHVTYLDMGEALDVACQESLCRGQTPAGTIAYVKDSEALDEACTAPDIDLVIFPEGHATCPVPGPQVLDFETFARKGSVAIYAEKGKFRIVFDQETPHMRPWSPGWRARGGQTAFEQAKEWCNKGIAYLLPKSSRLGYRSERTPPNDSGAAPRENITDQDNP